MFCSVMNYVALRLLGEGLDSSGPMLQARSWILVHGGATLTPSWGKFFLSVGNITRLFKYTWLYAFPFVLDQQMGKIHMGSPNL
jgi:hypothetical protein